MKELYYTDRAGISLDKVASMCDELLAQYTGLKKVLIVPPDYTRCYSFAGEITKILYPRLKAMGAEVFRRRCAIRWRRARSAGSDIRCGR